MPLALGASRAPSASAHAEPQGFSNFPQLPPPELEIETIMDLASVLPQSERETSEGQTRGYPAIFTAQGSLSGPLVPLLPFQAQGCHSGGTEVAGAWVATQTQKLVPGSSSHQARQELTLQGSTTVPARPGMNILGSETEDAQSTKGIESKIL